MRLCSTIFKLNPKTILALFIPSVYLLFFAFTFVSPKFKELNSFPNYKREYTFLNTTGENNIIFISNTSIAILKDKPGENATITFGRIPAKIISEDDGLVFVSIPECEFLVTKWPITVAIKMTTSNHVKVVGQWTYQAHYPDDYSLNIPEVNIAITWIPNLTLSQRFVFKQFIKTLDRTWRFQIFTLPNTKKDFMKDEFIREEIENGRVELSIMKQMGYGNWTSSQLNREYWKGMHGDRILSFQNDVVLCENPTSKMKDFYDYDLMTSLWAWDGWPHTIGNNGFAMRKRKFIMDVLTWDCPYFKDPTMKGKKIFDDRVIATCVENNKTAGVRVPPKWLSRSFCLEAIFHPHPIALHKPWNFWYTWSNEQRQTLFKNCPLLPKVCYNYERSKRKGKRIDRCESDEMKNLTLEEVLPLYTIND